MKMCVSENIYKVLNLGEYGHDIEILVLKLEKNSGSSLNTLGKLALQVQTDNLAYCTVKKSPNRHAGRHGPVPYCKPRLWASINTPR
jgi:hypothetical protein